MGSPSLTDERHRCPTLIWAGSKKHCVGSGPSRPHDPGFPMIPQKLTKWARAHTKFVIISIIFSLITVIRNEPLVSLHDLHSNVFLTQYVYELLTLMTFDLQLNSSHFERDRGKSVTSLTRRIGMCSMARLAWVCGMTYFTSSLHTYTCFASSLHTWNLYNESCFSLWHSLHDMLHFFESELFYVSEFFSDGGGLALYECNHPHESVYKRYVYECRVTVHSLLCYK
jgi:hypothetical protein